ncbi:MAG: histidine phosphatase family protein [Actinomycetota bacterium]|nr:MAG: histidine phosphatase family protein [Actinomycetota bacterium]
MEIVLIRHGEPEWVRDGWNVDNPPLTERGRRQAEQMAEALAGEQFDDVLVSPLVRARETARPLLEALARAEVVDPWLEEIRNPIWHGTPRDKAEAAYREDRARPAEQRWLGLEGGEPVRDFVQRIHTGARAFLAERGVRRASHELPVWEMRRSRSSHRSRRPCGYQQRHHLSPARPRSDAVGVGALRPRPWLDLARRVAAARRRAHVQPEQAERPGAPHGHRPHQMNRC